MTLHTAAHPWNKQATDHRKRHQAQWVNKWVPTFQAAQVGCAFCVSASWFFPHTVAKLVSDLEHLLGMEFVFTPGRPYRFMRVS